MSSEPAPRRSRATTTLVAAFVVGVVLVGTGIWLVWQWASRSSFGWFAYAPLSEVSFTIGWPNPWLALGLTGLGALLIGFASGYLLGRRPR